MIMTRIEEDEEEIISKNYDEGELERKMKIDGKRMTVKGKSW